MGDFDSVFGKKRIMCCVKLAKGVPVLLVCSLISYSYYCYVIKLCLTTITLPIEQIIFIVMYHIHLFMLLWCYWRTIGTRIGLVPLQFKLHDENDRSKSPNFGNSEDDNVYKAIERLGNDLPIATRTYIGGRPTFRYCFMCGHLKPDRCHHCRICGVCVLKMDHHCPWVNNCISYTNYKFFVLFLFYAFLFCCFIVITSLPYFLTAWKHSTLSTANGDIHIIFLFIIACMFFLSIMSIFGYHLYLITYNRTTLEAFRTPVFANGRIDNNGFNLGIMNNFKQIFGDKYWLWPFPVFTSSGDGIEFPHRYGLNSNRSLIDIV